MFPVTRLTTFGIAGARYFAAGYFGRPRLQTPETPLLVLPGNTRNVRVELRTAVLPTASTTVNTPLIQRTAFPIERSRRANVRFENRSIELEIPIMSLAWPTKDPDEILDYAIDWGGRLSGTTISTATWTVPAGLTKVSQSATTTRTVVRLSGGTLKQTYQILCRVVCADGQSLDQTMTLYIAAK